MASSALPARRRTRDRYDADSLLEVAVREFLRRGYDGTSMAELAAAAGLSKSSLYHHFPSKEEILGRALHRALDSLFSILDEPEVRSGRPRARLEALARRTAELLLERLPYVTLLLRVRGNSETERWALARRREFDHRVAGLVGEAVRAGDVRSDLDPGLAARLLLGMVNSLSEWYRPGGELAAGEIAAAVSELALRGLLGGGAAPRP